MASVGFECHLVEQEAHKLLRNVEGSRRAAALLRRNDPLHYGRGLGVGVWAAASRSLVPVVAVHVEESTPGGAVFRR